MKKSIALVALAFGVTSAFAQDLTSKKGEPFLPEAEDWGIGVDATPFLNYVGNFFGKSTSNTAPTWNYLTNNMTITGKKFKDANTAYRATVRLGLNSNTDKVQTFDRIAFSSTSPVFYPQAPTMVENKRKHSTTDIGISVGLEKRRGKTRLQGFYGAEVGFGISTEKDKYTYGNALSASTTAPIGVDSYNDASGDTHFFDGFNESATPTAGVYSYDNITTDSYGNAARVTTWKSGMGFVIGVRAFVGAEYFVAPKLSIGGEFGWGIGYMMQGKSKTTIESLDSGANTSSGTPAVGTQEMTGNKASGLMIDTDNNNSMFGPSGTLRLNLYF